MQYKILIKICNEESFQHVEPTCAWKKETISQNVVERTHNTTSNLYNFKSLIKQFYQGCIKKIIKKKDQNIYIRTTSEAKVGKNYLR